MAEDDVTSSENAEIRDSTTKGPMRGLGDLIARLLRLFAIGSCDACRRRAEAVYTPVPLERERS